MRLQEAIGGVAGALTPGALGVAATFLPTGESVFAHPDDVFPTASVIKIAIVAELFTQAAEKRVDLDAPVTITDDDLVAGSGVLSLLAPGLTLRLRDLATLAIAVSDNTASNLCLNHVGGPAIVNKRMQSAWGMTNTVIHRPIRFVRTGRDRSAHGGGPVYEHTATGTPRDFLRLLTLLANGAVHDRAVSDQTLRLLGETQDNTLLPRYLAVNPYADDLGVGPAAFSVRHKTGAVGGVRNDAGLITRAGGGGTLAVCVFTKGVTDGRWTPANAGSEAVARIGQLLCEHFFGEASPS